MKWHLSVCSRHVLDAMHPLSRIRVWFSFHLGGCCGCRVSKPTITAIKGFRSKQHSADRIAGDVWLCFFIACAHICIGIWFWMFVCGNVKADVEQKCSTIRFQPFLKHSSCIVRSNTAQLRSWKKKSILCSDSPMEVSQIIYLNNVFIYS